MTRRNIRHFSLVSGQLTPTSVCLRRHREHDIATSVDTRGDSSNRKIWVLRRWYIAMVHRIWFHNYLRVCTALQSLSKTAFPLWFYAYDNYKNRNSARRTYLQRHIRPSITQTGSDNFSSGISGNLPQIATSNVIFSNTADYIAGKFCITIKKIKPHDIFQNCVHSTGTLTYIHSFGIFQRSIFKTLHIIDCFILF